MKPPRKTFEVGIKPKPHLTVCADIMVDALKGLSEEETLQVLAMVAAQAACRGGSPTSTMASTRYSPRFTPSFRA
jgi:hypothetical protein